MGRACAHQRRPAGWASRHTCPARRRFTRGSCSCFSASFLPPDSTLALASAATDSQAACAPAWAEAAAFAASSRAFCEAEVAAELAASFNKANNGAEVDRLTEAEGDAFANDKPRAFTRSRTRAASREGTNERNSTRSLEGDVVTRSGDASDRSWSAWSYERTLDACEVVIGILYLMLCEMRRVFAHTSVRLRQKLGLG